MLVDDDPSGLAAAVAAAAMPAERPPLYGDGHASERIAARSALRIARPMKRDIAIVGAGYVGVPLAQVFAEAGSASCSSTSTAERVDAAQPRRELHRGRPVARCSRRSSRAACHATTDYDELRDADAILIALPTPLSRQREPDLSIVIRRRRADRDAPPDGPPRRARVDDLPGHDARGDPADPRGGSGPHGRRGLPPRVLARARRPRAATTGRRRTCPRSSAASRRRAPSGSGALRRAIDTVHRVSSPEAAELTKLLENIFRSVNIALVNELAQLCDRMDIDVWEVVDAAATKPFGFMRFSPGPGLGGHCIPIDPFYLTWKAREYGFYTEFIELAGKVNENMPYYCRSLVSQALNHARSARSRARRCSCSASPTRPTSATCASRRAEADRLLRKAGAEVSYHDPHVPELAEHGLEIGRARPGRVRLRRDRHRPPAVDYAQIVEDAELVVDLRNATGDEAAPDKVLKL